MIKLVVDLKTVTWKQFCHSSPAYSIALDGYVRGGPRFDFYAPRANFNHHEDVDRLATRSTCAQVLMAIRQGLFEDCFRDKSGPVANVYVNDCDEDVCTSWALLNNQGVFDLVQLWSEFTGEDKSTTLEYLYRTVEESKRPKEPDTDLDPETLCRVCAGEIPPSFGSDPSLSVQYLRVLAVTAPEHLTSEQVLSLVWSLHDAYLGAAMKIFARAAEEGLQFPQSLVPELVRHLDEHAKEGISIINAVVCTPMLLLLMRLKGFDAVRPYLGCPQLLCTIEDHDLRFLSEQNRTLILSILARHLLDTKQLGSFGELIHKYGSKYPEKLRWFLQCL